MEMIKMQVHVQIDDYTFAKFQEALKKLGYVTTSEFIRAQIRSAIENSCGVGIK
jgi:metal-responsive CopG/Arc/MetJ family transcriptional regulator